MSHIRATPPRYAIVLLGIAVFLAYGNTFDSAWHLDDFERIVHNPTVQVSDLGPGDLHNFFRVVWNDGWLQRPLAFTSIAVNWYFGADNPFGYHLFNISIHLFSALLLYLVFTHLFQTPRLSAAYTKEQAGFISLLAVFLWALNPVQTQATTYVIQRMASMSAMFFILAMYLYLRGRMTYRWPRKIGFFLCCLISSAASFFSKENGATLPLTLLLVEAVFFQDLSQKRVRVFFTSLSLIIIAFGAALGVIVFFGGDVLNVLKYEDRTFTPWERLLSQPRALLLYLSLVIYPVPTRLSITHDFENSSAIFQPWTTLPSLAVVIGLIALSVLRIRRLPLASFAILFFFVNHAIESSIIPLEMVFEHRNYLPSTFIFLAVAAGIRRTMDYFRYRSRVVVWSLWVFVPLLIIGLGTGTYVRNQAWQSEKTLWEDAAEKAPGESRPYHMLAAKYYQRIGDFDTAMRLYRLSLNLRKPRISHEALIYNNMAAMYYGQKNYDAAVELWMKTIEVLPESKRGRFHLSVALSRTGRFDEAMVQIEEVLKEHPGYFGPTNLKGVILIRQGKYLEALAALKQGLKPGITYRPTLINLGVVFHYLGDYSKAIAFLQEAMKLNPNDRTAFTWLALNYLSAGKTKAADDAIARLLATGPAGDVNIWLKSCEPETFEDDEVVAPDLNDVFTERLQLAWRRATGDSTISLSACAMQFEPIW